MRQKSRLCGMVRESSIMVLHTILGNTLLEMIENLISCVSRHPDFKDPPYEPAKLFRVQRIKPVKGNPYWEKDILKALKLDGKISDVVIIKNIPEMNSKLWRIKHLVKIEPITFPDGFPKDNRGTYLKENGELAVKNELIASETSLEKAEEFKTDSKRLDGETLRRDSRLKWLSDW